MKPVGVRLASEDGTELAALSWSARADAPAVLVVHGLGSRKENHADFAAMAAAQGWAALALDLRGHGESAGAIGPGMVDDVRAALDWLRDSGHPALGVRGSSLGGFLALHAARHPGVRAVVAICPATPEGLAERVGGEWPLTMPLGETIHPDDGVARGIWHARGDEVVPWRASAALAGMAPDTTRLRILDGGGHRTLQHDPRILAETIGFLAGEIAAAHA